MPLTASFACAMAAPGDTPGVTSTEITLGQSVYLTGALAELGRDFTAGADAYFRRVNAQGGVAGRRIRVVTLDDAYDPKRALANVETLEQRGVLALWQFAGTGTVHAVADLADERGIPLVAAIATGPALRAAPHPETFYVRAGNVEELQAVVQHLTTLGATSVAAVYVDAPYGREGLAEIEKAMKAHGLGLVAREVIGLDGARSDAAIRHLATVSPQATILVTVPASTKALLTAARRASLTTQFYALNAGLPIGTAHELGEIAHGVVVCQVMPNVDDDAIPVVHEFRESYAAAGRRNYTSAALEGFVDAKIMVEALRRAGRGLDRETLVRALEGMSSFDAGGYIVHFSREHHAGGHAVELSILSEGGERFLY